MNTSFWRDKCVLLTGHTGFKGSWLSLWLQSMGAQVVGYALAPPTNPSLFEVAEVGNGMTSVIGDIRDLEHLREVFAEHQPEIVIHMAAQPLVRYSYSEPVETYSTNVMGTVNLLEAVRNTSSVKAVVNVTSDKCYENREWVWGYRENEAMGGHDPYSNSKGCAELVTAAYRNSFFQPSTINHHLPWPRPEQAMSSVVAIGQTTGSSRTSCVPLPNANRSTFVTRMPFVLGSTYWSRCPGIYCWHKSFMKKVRCMRKAGTSGRTIQMPNRYNGSWKD